MATTVLHPSSIASLVQGKTYQSVLQQSPIDREDIVLDAMYRAYVTKTLMPLRNALSVHEQQFLSTVCLEMAKKADDCGKEMCKFSGMNISAPSEWKAFIRKLLIKVGREDDAGAILDILIPWNFFNRYEDFLRFKLLGERLSLASNLSVVEDNVLKQANVLLTDRRDLTWIKSFAVDEKYTTDIDDAVSFDKSTSVVLVHIADPTSYLPGGHRNPIIKNAERNIQTIYFDGRKYSMFPEHLSQKVLSLGGSATSRKYAITHEFSVRDDGSLDETSFKTYKSVISRPEQVTYKSVAKSLSAETAPSELMMLSKLALMRREYRSAKIPEKYRNSYERVSVQNFEARVLVEEMMIACNHVAATLAQRWKVPVIYRGSGSFEGPFVSKASMMGGSCWEKSYDNVLLSTRATFHAKLGLQHYAQVTSPLRKFVDLVGQIQFSAHLKGDKPPYDESDLNMMIPKISKAEKEAHKAETRLKKFRDFEKIGSMIGSTFTGKLLHPVSRRKESCYGKSGCSKARKSTFGPHWNTTGSRRQTKTSTQRWRDHQSCMTKIVDWRVRLDNFDSPIIVKAPINSRPGSNVYVRIAGIDSRTSYVKAAVC